MLTEYFEEIQRALHALILSQFPSLTISPSSLALDKPPQLEMGEFAYSCFALARDLKKKPMEIAARLAASFTSHPYIASLEAAGPYVNIRIHRKIFANTVCEAILKTKEDFGRSHRGKGKRVMVEYSSPNTNKPLHIGHVRNNLLGMALANLLSFCSYDVVKANLINDRGIHICKSMLAYQKWGEGKTPESTGLKGDHFVGKFYVQFENALKSEREAYAQQQGIDFTLLAKSHLDQIKEKIKETKNKEEKEALQKELQRLTRQSEELEEKFLKDSAYYAEAMELLRQWEKGDSEVRALWKKMNDWVMQGFEETYAKLGCIFDKIYRESETYTLGRDHVEKGLAKGVFYKKEDGSIWVSAEKLKEAAPESFQKLDIKDKILLRSDGTSVYITQDIGTAILKAEDYHLDQSIYVVASEQNLHFKNLFALLKLLGFPWASGCYHAAYGMVTLPKGLGRIKSREGTAVDADDLIYEMTERAKEKMKEENLRVAEEILDETALSIALAALKIFILQVHPEKDLQFDPNKTIEFTGDTGPAIQYSYARIRSIFRKAAEQNIAWKEDAPIHYELLSSPEEFALLRQLSDFPDIIDGAAQSYNISLLANYLLDLTRNYASIYTAFPVLKAETDDLRNARLALAHVTSQVLKNGMAILGASVPESM